MLPISDYQLSMYKDEELIMKSVMMRMEAAFTTNPKAVSELNYYASQLEQELIKREGRFKKPIRKSLTDRPRNMVKDGNYPGVPQELEPYHYWIADCGNSILSIPKCLLEEAKSDGELWKFEVPVACSYVLREGYEFFEGYVVVDVPYDNNYGVKCDEYNW